MYKLFNPTNNVTIMKQTKRNNRPIFNSLGDYNV